MMPDFFSLAKTSVRDSFSLSATAPTQNVTKSNMSLFILFLQLSYVFYFKSLTFLIFSLVVNNLPFRYIDNLVDFNIENFHKTEYHLNTWL